MAAEPTKPVKVFYSYAREDREFLEKLKTHLAGLKQRKMISEWHDGEISAGTEWDKEIKKQLDSADVILLLVSPDFINSDYSNSVEVKKAIDRHDQGTARVIPVILRPVNWNGLPFSHLEALPPDSRPVTSWPNRDEAFLEIANGIEKAIGELNLSAPSPLTEENAPRLSPLSHIEPQSAVGFVPRKDRDGNDIVEQLRAGLAPGSSRVIALWGAGGVGKTALAAEAVRSLIHDYQQRIAWVSADGRDEFDLPNLLDEIASQLGRPELRTLTLETKKHEVHELVTEKPTLIVLDNFETVKPKEQPNCLEWLSRVAPSSALITTRAKIELAAVRNIPIESMLVSEANEFLDRLIQQAQHRSTFEGIDTPRLIQTSEANPLILQWVFAQIDLAQDWREVLDELAQGEGDAAHRVFDRSYNLPLLNKGGRATLLALSLFVPSASRSALAEVAGLSDRKKFKEATKHLAALWLIRATEDVSRLTVEGLTRDLAKARLDSDQRSASIRKRFVARFDDFAKSNSKVNVSDLNALEAERENVLAAIEVALGIGNLSSAIAIYFHIQSFQTIRGYWDDSINRGNSLRTAVLELKDKNVLSHIAETVANTMLRRGEYAEAEQIYYQSLETFSELKSEGNIAITLFNLGELVRQRGEFQQARQFYDQSLEIYKRLGNQKEIARTFDSLGSLAYYEGVSSEARRLYSASMEIKKRRGDQNEIAISLHDLGTLDEQEGKIDDARQLYLEGLEIGKRLGNQSYIATVLSSLGLLAREEGRLEEALQLATQSLEIEKRLGDQGGQANSMRELGRVAFEQGDTVKARQLYEESLEIESRLGKQVDVAVCLHELGVLDLAEGQLDSSRKSLEQSLDIFQKLNVKINLAEALEAQGKLNAAQECFTEAREFYREALEVAKELSQKVVVGNIKYSSALLAEKENNVSHALELLREALEIFESLGFAKAEKVKADLRRLESS